MTETRLWKSGDADITCDGKRHWVNHHEGRRWSDGKCNCSRGAKSDLPYQAEEDTMLRAWSVFNPDGDVIFTATGRDAETEARAEAGRLNEAYELGKKVTNDALIEAAEHLGICANITCDLCKSCREVVRAAKGK